MNLDDLNDVVGGLNTQSKAPDIQTALNDLSAKLDAIFAYAIGEYCKAENDEYVVADVPSYRQ
ncbi:MAG: hypothetical protein IKN80_04110 [Clostridiales bacterium]|nr:hypothetical protein [Clostridiales bacterium]